ncbi:Asp-tRNA(Asn)/Glu-tRNA(Gln) amidotransferase subunit GatA [Ruminiclostridium cellulolyticum]|uniref:Glutamyl-tRNA(Gln) amidotransferase subunit A n=1 Tax=Ruminiclostridium cellulolyticum (strain ATCC 35319 / DSM 5812 / JCM 6584 / H10) TaxID=394503 RepID=GATA_RUMCH|nr:Asp-tRNA(Asn)/Glu-tRNA(Gln) amidotransferase subunit GatA [Ruminiclostridium cellulolyticum]B8I601.1 RecName: Full=Glutamyl-tRNA(Gln) amidotransferase subunit A; Short=Glu-ADT subunit A [Ruminiclostridium cellulolyticum H10]ACL76766.1 glutamyl-tRNA(Gln) amidotransferase, A subunit [Ruminiclostridium cellulolyticum H10]
MDITRLTIKEARKLLDNREISALELTRTYLDRINTLDGKVESYLSVTEDMALKQAEQAQNLIDYGKASLLTGIPLSIKDNICIEGTKTTCASKMLEDFVSPYTATAVDKLFADNAVILGKTNLDEFAMGGSTENSAFKITKNPFDLTRVPGGSSGGSAACVSASLALGSLGSDTGGSVRQPASFCGVVGMKPTYGLVSRYGLVAFASSFDQIGPIAKTVEDCAIILDSICGNDPKDATSLKYENDSSYSSSVSGDIKGFKFGLPKEYLTEGLNAEVKESLYKSIDKLESMGAKIEEFSMPVLKHAVPAYYLMSSAEASSNLSRYDGVKYGYRADNCKSFNELIGKSRAEGFGKEVKRRILLGTYSLASGYYDAYYKKALKLRTLISNGFNEAFTKYDVVLHPTTPETAFKIGQNSNSPLAMYLADIYTVAVNIAGLPSISLPCGYDSNGLPIGLSFTGKPLGEKDIFRAAASFEAEFSDKFRVPAI